MGNPIHHLTALGADAMDNMYDVKVTIPSSAGIKMPPDVPSVTVDGGLVITGRLTGFTVPGWKVGTYDIKYHGVSKKMPNTKIEMERKIELEFRYDSNYLWYKAWKALANHGANAQTGGVANWIPGIGDVAKDSFITDNVSNSGIVLEVVALKTSYLGIDAPASGDLGVLDFDNKDEVIKWTFKQFWAGDCSEPAFKTDGGDAMKFKVTGYFGDCDYPDSGLWGPGAVAV